MPFKPMVFRRGLFVVLFPAALASIFVLILNNLWLTTGKISQEEEKRSEVVLRLSMCFDALVAYSYDIMTCSFDNQPDLKDKTEKDRKRFVAVVSSLAPVSNQDQNGGLGQGDRIEALRKMAVSLADDTEKLVPELAGEQFNSNVARFIRYSRLMTKGLKFADAMDAVVCDELAEARNIRAQSARLTSALRQLVLWGLPLGICAAISVLFFFARDIVWRLKNLALNASNLIHLPPSAESQKGLDEFSYLDQVFRQSALELREAADQRQAIMQMLAHDMRSPIMATQVYVEILQEVNAETLSADAKASCLSIKRDLNSVHEFVSDLLLAEKLEYEPIELKIDRFSLSSALDKGIGQVEDEAAERGISLCVEGAEIMIAADREYIVQAFVSMLRAAIALCIPGATICAAFANSTENTKLSIRFPAAQLAGAHANYFFDSSHAVPPVDASGLSDTGLSMRIARLIVEAHGGMFGGKADVENNWEIWFSLPLEVKNSGQAQLPLEGKNVSATVSPKDLFSSSSFRNCIVVFVAALVLQAACLLFLDNRLQASQLLAGQAAAQSDTIVDINRLWLCLFRANTTTAFYLATGSRKSLEQSAKNIAEAKEKIGALNLSFQKKERSPLWTQVRSFILDGLARLKTMSDRSEEERAANDLGLLGKLVEQAGTLNSQLQDLLNYELNQLRTIRIEQELLRNRVQSIILLAIAGNLVMTVLLLWVFAADISKRLNLITLVARKIPQRAEITEMVAGNDEIYRIYWLLCRASLNLRDALEHRRAIMNMVAKDIGQPLSSVQAAVSELVERLPAEVLEKSSASLNSVRDNINRLLTLVDDLLVLDGLDEGKLPLDICDCRMQDILQASLNSVGGLAVKKQITIESSSEDFSFAADRKRLIQLVVNLLGNAIKFSPNQSRISLNGAFADGKVIISVSDQGPGISSDDAERIFLRFYQTAGAARKQGFGLGLAICSLIARSHQGEILLKSEIGQGSTFSVAIPTFPESIEP